MMEHGTVLTQRINSYIAVLIITVFGSGAALIIMHVVQKASTGAYASTLTSEAL